jgi:SWI/SNF-related matrix-associated actin-dependent regulator 1 of chromatin subfamily A
MSALVQLSPGLDRLAGVHLYPHQADGVAFLVSKRRAVLGDDMGLGKTRQAIAAMEAAAPEGAVLVVCPASLKLNWRREILLVDPAARIEVIGVDREPVTDARWVIVNYDRLDEAHFIKNASQRTSHVLKLLGVQDERRAAPIGPKFVFLLTGTPMTNRPKDLFNLLRCVGHPAARSFIGFARHYCAAYRNDVTPRRSATGASPSPAPTRRSSGWRQWTGSRPTPPCASRSAT